MRIRQTCSPVSLQQEMQQTVAWPWPELVLVLGGGGGEGGGMTQNKTNSPERSLRDFWREQRTFCPVWGFSRSSSVRGPDLMRTPAAVSHRGRDALQVPQPWEPPPSSCCLQAVIPRGPVATVCDTLLPLLWIQVLQTSSSLWRFFRFVFVGGDSCTAVCNFSAVRPPHLPLVCYLCLAADISLCEYSRLLVQKFTFPLPTLRDVSG